MLPAALTEPKDPCSVVLREVSTLLDSIEQSHQQICEKHNFCSLVGLVVVDRSMRCWILEGADRSGEQFHRRDLLTWVGLIVDEWSAVSLERQPHESHSNDWVRSAS